MASNRADLESLSRRELQALAKSKGIKANLKSADLQATLRRMRSDGRPVIAIADDDLCGAAAGLFLAASERVCTSTTIFSLPECSVGLCPTTAPARSARTSARSARPRRRAARRARRSSRPWAGTAT